MKRIPLVPLIVACALFMENTDSTVIATSLPAIAADLGEDPISLKLALTSYLVSLAIFIPISGWMADRFGARTVFRSALAVFMLGSILCAISQTLPHFVAARFVQGLGGAMMVPVGRLVILRSVPKSEMVAALAYLTVPAMVGPVVGPPLGGFITTYFDWRWIFFINIPIGIVGIALATIFIENVREEDVPPLDVRGFLLAGLGFASLMLGLATGGRHLIPGWASVLMSLAGFLFLALYLRHSRRIEAPVLNLGLLRIPTFRASVVGGSIFRVGVGAVPFLLPLMLQLGFGMNPLQSGLLTFAAAAGALFVKTVANKALRRFGFKRVLLINSVIAGAFIGANALFTPQTPHFVMLAALFFGGCLRSLQFTAINALGYADVSNREMSYATSLANVAQQLSLSVGVAFGAFVLEMSAQLRGNASPDFTDFSPAFLAVSAVSILSVFVMARLPADAGAEVSGHRFSSRRATAEAVQDTKPHEH